MQLSVNASMLDCHRHKVSLIIQINVYIFTDLFGFSHIVIREFKKGRIGVRNV